MADTSIGDATDIVSGTVRLSAAQIGTWSEEPTMALRFLERGGRRILQQAWLRHNFVMSETAWRDVPLEIETP